MKKLIIIFCLIAIHSSCKKDQLKDEKAIFIGKWEWITTHHYYNACEGAAIYETLTPISEGSFFQLEFQTKGVFIFRKNNLLISTYKIKFDEFVKATGDSDFGWYHFEIKLNNDKNLRAFRGSLNMDTLITSGFEGFEMTEIGVDGCEGYSSTFIKK